MNTRFMFTGFINPINYLLGDISNEGGLIMSEEEMMSIISRVSSKYSIKLSSKESQALIEGIKVKAAQQGRILKLMN